MVSGTHIKDASVTKRHYKNFESGTLIFSFPSHGFHHETTQVKVSPLFPFLPAALRRAMRACLI